MTPNSLHAIQMGESPDLYFNWCTLHRTSKNGI